MNHSRNQKRSPTYTTFRVEMNVFSASGRVKPVERTECVVTFDQSTCFYPPSESTNKTPPWETCGALVCQYLFALVSPFVLGFYYLTGIEQHKQTALSNTKAFPSVEYRNFLSKVMDFSEFISISLISESTVTDPGLRSGGDKTLFLAKSPMERNGFMWTKWALMGRGPRLP